MTVRVALDMFPATLTLPGGGTVTPCRIYVVDNELVAYVAGSGEPRVYFRRPIISIEGNPTRGYDFQVEDGIAKATKAGGCGCGNALQRFNAFAGETRVAVPL